MTPSEHLLALLRSIALELSWIKTWLAVLALAALVALAKAW